MNAHRRGTLAAALAVLALLVLGLSAAVVTSGAGQEPKRTRSEFMRQKLEFSKNVLEGLSLEQYGTIEKNARNRNIDGATLAYLKLTMNCVQCHKYVRFASQ